MCGYACVDMYVCVGMHVWVCLCGYVVWVCTGVFRACPMHFNVNIKVMYVFYWDILFWERCICGNRKEKKALDSFQSNTDQI